MAPGMVSLACSVCQKAAVSVGAWYSYLHNEFVRPVPHLGLSQGTTALMLASAFGLIKVVELLLLSENLNAVSEDQETALHFAATAAFDDNVVELLLRNGADINKKDIWGHTALSWACKSYHHSAAKLLLDWYGDAGLKYSDARLALQAAAEYGNDEAVAVIMKSGGDVNKMGVAEALYEAATNSHRTIIEQILDLRPQINVSWQNSDGLFLLHIAAESCSEAMVQYLLDQGADANVRDRHGRTVALRSKKGFR